MSNVIESGFKMTGSQSLATEDAFKVAGGDVKLSWNGFELVFGSWWIRNIFEASLNENASALIIGSSVNESGAKVTTIV